MKKKMTEAEALKTFPMHYSPKDRKCVICRKKKSDLRFGVCFSCAKE